MQFLLLLVVVVQKYYCIFYFFPSAGFPSYATERVPYLCFLHRPHWPLEAGVFPQDFQPLTVKYV